MANFRETTITTMVDVDGVETSTKIEKSTNITRSEEPDYIKVYTNMWAEFNGVPQAYRGLFLQLASRMSYSDATDLKNSQIVCTGGPIKAGILKALKWKEDMYNKGLRELVKAEAIKRIGRGYYQINPSYAGKGEWKYNPRLQRGGVEDLVAVFNFKDKIIDTKIVWADNGDNELMNQMYREGMGVKASDETVLSCTIATPLSPDEDNTKTNGEYQLHFDFAG